MLRGLGDDLAAGAGGAAGMRVRAYCPVGDLVAGMAYLVRRLLENTANESFLSDQARGADSTSCWRRRERRSPTSRCWSCAARAARESLTDALRELDDGCRSRCRC